MDGYLNVLTASKGMLHQGKVLLYSTILLAMGFSCGQPDERVREKYNITLNTSLQIVGDSTYRFVLKSANDTISNWIENDIPFFARFEVDSVRLDSLVCFNQNGSKAVMARLSQCRRNCTQDDIHFFYGVKITGKWYFFSGATIVLAREGYQKDLHTPLSFTKLHEIELQEVFSGYLKRKDLGFWRNVFGKTEYEVNEAFFNGFASKNQAASGYGSCFHCKTEDEYFIYLVNKNWASRDTTNYKPLK